MAIGTTGRTIVARAVGGTLLVLGVLGSVDHRLDEVGNVVDDAAELQSEHQQ
jgi:hypothetical protein